MISVHDTDIPYVDAGQMIRVDRIMMDDYKIGLIQMMENAGRNLAHLARRRFLAGSPLGTRVAVLAGPGGNGGGAMVAARRLHSWGAVVHVSLGRAVGDLTTMTQHQYDILRRLKIPVNEAPPRDAEGFDLILDGLIGYSLSGSPRGMIGELIVWANQDAAPVLALDIPSGMDATTGAVFDPAITASATLALALPKSGVRAPGNKDRVGELYVADIGVPPELYASPGLNLSVGPIFAREDIIRLW